MSKLKRMRDVAADKLVRIFMAVLLALGLIPSELMQVQNAYADTGTLSVTDEYFDFEQYDSNTGATWSDTFMYINGNLVMCIDIQDHAYDGAAYSSQPMDGGRALRVGLYDKYLNEAHGDWSANKHYGYLQYMVWLIYNTDYMNAYVSPNEPDFWDVYAGAQAYYDANQADWVGSGTEWISDSSQNTTIIPSLTPATGSLAINKVSGDTSKTDGSSCYSLAGATYGVYSDASCSTLVATMTTGADGKARVDGIRKGNYWVKEISASAGYALDTNIYATTVNKDITTEVTSTEMPKSDPVGMLVSKSDVDFGEHPQGAASLEGAQFTVSFYKGQYDSAEQAESSGAAARSWVFATDADGFAYFSDAYKVSGDAFYYQSDGHTATLPLGTVIIQETKAPEGYNLDDGAGGAPKKFCVRITDSGVVGESVYTYNTPKIPDSVIRGGVEVRKVDNSTGNDPQGDASLAGAVLDIVTLNDNSVQVDGTSYSKGSVVKQLTIAYDASAGAYTASCTGCLPYGTYEIHESAAPVGYLLNPDWSRTFQISYNGQVTNLTTDADALQDSVIRGGVQINKADTQTDVTFQGDATFAGAEFEIVNESANSVVVDGKVCVPGSVVTTITTQYDATTGLAIASTSGTALPYGSYRIVETKAPTGYLNKGTLDRTFEVRSQGVVVDLTSTPIKNDVIRGGVMINKVDTQTGLSAQGDATFEGALFNIKNLSDGPVLVDGTLYQPGEVCKTITTSYDTSSGRAIARTASDCLPYGTYSIEEVSAPQGYLNEGSLYRTFLVRHDGVTIDLTTEPIANDVIRGGVQINKTDVETDINPQGDATFEHTVFEIVNESAQIVRVDGKNYQPGEVVKTMEVELDSATGLYVARTSADCLPYGSYCVRESVAPTGYLHTGVLERHFQIRENGHVVDLTSTPIKNDVIRGGVQINKSDVQTGTDEQGDATFVGAEFSITNKSTHAVLVDGALYQPGEVCKVITTEADAVTSLAIAKTTSDCLPYGTYSLDETKAPTGYLNTGDLHRDFQIRENGAMIDLTSEPIANDVIRGGVRIEKDDKELGKSEAISGKNHASTEGPCLTGIAFEITNTSLHPVVVGDKTYATGEAIKTIYTYWNEDLKAYVADTPTNELPYGTYRIQEVSTNKTYLLTDGTPRTFQVRTDGEIATTNTAGESLTFYDQVVRNDMELSKKADDTNEAMQAAFKITNVVTGEAHVLVCDRNGDASTAASWNLHTRNTNANDKLLETDSIKAADFDTDAGIWFGLGEDGSVATPNDSLAALPYGHYTLEELRSDTNEGYDLITRDVWISRDSTIARAVWMSLDDKPSEAIHTQAKDADDGNQYADADDEVTITDTVYYENLKTDGREYTVTGTLMVKSTNSPLLDAEGNPVTATKTFKPMSPIGSIELAFTFDGSLLAGETVVVFEDLECNGKVVATHSDITDEGQSVCLVRIGTTATDEADGDKYVTGATVTISDEVAYEGLSEGNTYTLKATLMDADTGKAVQREGALPILTENVTAEATFTPEAANGTATITLECDVEDLGGQRLVVFEKLYDESDELVATHEDLTDEGQSVHVPEIGTTLTDATDGDHVIENGSVTVIDTVAYEGLIPGEYYTVEGTLMSKTTGEAFLSGGKMVVANATFKAEEASGKVDVAFVFSTGDLAEGEALVAFEELYSAEGNIIAIHKDIEDADQTVVIDYPDTADVPETPSTSYDKTGVQLPDEPCVPVACGIGAACAAAIAWTIHRSRKSRDV